MTLLEKMRQAIGGPSFDEEYKARVRCTLYAALSDFTTFNAAVNVIDVDHAEEDMMPTPTTKTTPFKLQEVEMKQEVDSPLLAEDNHAYFEAGTQWPVDLLPSKSVIHLPPDTSDEEHVSVNDHHDGNLVGVIVQSKRARLAAEAAEKLKKK